MATEIAPRICDEQAVSKDEEKLIGKLMSKNEHRLWTAHMGQLPSYGRRASVSLALLKVVHDEKEEGSLMIQSHPPVQLHVTSQPPDLAELQ
jgi:hypothetical protein